MATGAEPTWDLQGNTRFELRRRLGSGGFGAVFEVFDRERGARVALKLLKRVEAVEVYQFKQEFRALADLAHENLVRLYELQAAGDRWFFTMELVDGTSLLSYVRRERDLAEAPTLDARHLAAAEGATPDEHGNAGERFDEARLRSVLVQLVEGLSALHRAGKMHRDVKPSNVLVTPEGRVVLVDFGLAVRLTGSGEISRSALVGTPTYLAPELVRGEPATAASDWYAVGVMLFEALTGDAPFHGPIHKVLGEKITRDAPAPSTVVPGVPADLDRLCVDLLARRVESRPTGAELLERLGSAILHVSPREAPFVGRARERAAIAALFAEGQRAGGASVALLSGPSGIGKSTLVARVTADLREAAPDAVILTGRCWEQESVPYKAIDGLVDPLSRYLRALPRRVAEDLLPPEVRSLVRIFPVLEQVEVIRDAPSPPIFLRTASEIRRGAFRALRQLLGRLGASRPLVIVIDDLQWGDQDSGALLADLLAPPDPPPLLLIAAYRSDEAATSPCLRVALPALAGFRDPRFRVTSLAIEPLAATEAVTLARALLPEGTDGRDDVAAAVAREAGGRPFFIRELAGLSRDRPAAEGEDVSVDALVEARTAALSPGARRLLEILAVAGRPVDRAAAAQAAELGDDEPAVYSALRGARLARRRDGERDEIEVYHDRIRETVAAHLTPSRRREAFGHLASALDARGLADAETLADYFEEAGDRSRAAALVGIAAGEASRSLALARAVRLRRRAIELLDAQGADDPRLGPLQEALGEALATAGWGVEAAEALVRAADLAPPAQTFDLRRRAAEQLLFAGRVDAGMEALAANLAEVGVPFPRGNVRVVLGFLLYVAWIHVRGFQLRPRARPAAPEALLQIDACIAAAKALATVETVRGAYFSARATTLALSAADRGRAGEALLIFCVYAAAILGSFRAFVARARAAFHELATTAGARGSGQAALVRGVIAIFDGDLPAAAEPLATAQRLFDEDPTDTAWEQNTVREFTFQRLLWSGALAELAERVGAAIADARDRGNEHLVRALTLRFGHVPALLRDDPDAAIALLDAARAGWWPKRFSTLDCFVLWSRGDVLLYAERSRGAAARAHVEAGWPALARSPLLRIAQINFAAYNVRARASLAFAASEGAREDDRAAAIGVAEDAARHLAANRDPLSHALGALVEAGVADVRGDAQGAIQRFARAEEALSAIAGASYRAAARRRRGILLGGDEGRALVLAAEAFFQDQGARDPGRLAAVLVPSSAAPRR